MDRQPNPALAATRIFAERLVPVCSPSYLRSLLNPKGQVALSRATLLHVTTVTEETTLSFFKPPRQVARLSDIAPSADF
jgi:hypothetical protein